jgi:hypothetical protein
VGPLAALAQTVAIAPCSVPGVAVSAPPTAEYFEHVDEVAGSDRSANLNAWLPFGVAVTNRSSQNIVALVVRWVVTNPQGQTTPYTVLPEMFDQPRQQVAPGKSVIVLPPALLEASHLPRQLQMNRIGAYQSAQRIEASLDGIVFASGQFVGRNVSKAYDEFVAETTVPAHVGSTVLAMRQSGEAIGTVVAWLETSAKAGVNTPTAHITARTAKLLVESYKRGGEALLYEVAHGFAQGPAIHVYK